MTNLVWRKRSWFKEIVRDLEDSNNDISMGDKLIIKNSVDSFVEEYFAMTGECPPTSWPAILVVYDRLFPFGFRSNFSERSNYEAVLISEAYKKLD